MIDRETLIELHLYNRGVARAKASYYGEAPFFDCPEDICTPKVTCWRCRKRARADLIVATSEAECVELLAIIDRPGPAAVQCGTIGGYTAHYRRGEKPCHNCRAAHSRYRQAQRAVGKR